jgi:predicted SnoaL-like aldol condensation-catalyzing enzyme
MTTQTETMVQTPQREAAVSFLRLASSGKVREAFDRYVASDFRHHNPHFAGDARSLAAGMVANATQNPDKVLEIQRVLEDGDLVAVHSGVRLKPDTPVVAVVHIFRFEERRIAEMWDIGQPEPGASPNQNGMF